MSFHGDTSVKAVSLSSAKQDFLIREIFLTHEPDDRKLDSGLLLDLVETTFYSTTENTFDAQLDAITASDIDLVGSKEPISLIINKISNEILCKCFGDETLHRKTLALLELLRQYRWDVKVVVALASFASSFGLFWLILRLQSDNAMAVSLATVKQLPKAISKLQPKLKALNLLINTMLKLTKLIIHFEGMSLQQELMEDTAMDNTKSKIYMATYWILTSVLVCSSQIADLRNLGLEQVYSDRTVIAAWGLHSVGTKLNSLCCDLGEHVHECQHQIETRFHNKLRDLFNENQVDNQKALRALFGLQNEFPFRNPSSGDKCGVFELKDKVVILLISKPELLPMDKIFMLVQQTCERRNSEDSYGVLWVPVPSLHEWSLADKTNFEFLSNSLPWFSIRRPWSLNSIVANYIRQEWSFEEDPIMVVLNENGMVTNTNAMDMVWIWGPKAFPFSTSREKELWEQENLTLGLMISGINPLLTQWVEEGKDLCIYGSDDIDFVREFSATMKRTKSAGNQVEVVYVGCKNHDENVKAIIDTIDQESLCTSLTFTKVDLFWFRLESIKRSISKLPEFLDLDSSQSWAVIGRGSSTDVLKLGAEKLRGCIDLFPWWCKNVAAMGLVGAIEPSLGDGTCINHTQVIPYEEGMVDKPLICASCKRPMEKFLLYKCDG